MDLAEQAMNGDMARRDMLILVDGLDRQVGTATKEDAHRHGLLHRAFSVVLVRERTGVREVLLSRRATGKYHSGGLWANSCCSHPRNGEDVTNAAYRRVREELGCEACDLHEVAAFAYRTPFENGLVEHEFDHVLVGTCTGELAPDPSEVSEVRWISMDDIARDLGEKPDMWCAWAPMVLTLALAR